MSDMKKTHRVPRKPISNNKSKAKKDNPFAVPMIIIGFSLICLVTSFFMGLNSGDAVKSSFDSSGGLIGPLVIEKSNTVYELNLNQYLRDGDWSSVSVDLLDKEQKLLFTYNKEFWAESGVDYEGYHWSESDSKSTSKFTIKDPGTYFVRINAETSVGVSNKIKAKLNKKRGSSIPHFIVGIIALIVGLIMYWFRIDPRTRAQLRNM